MCDAELIIDIVRNTRDERKLLSTDGRFESLLKVGIDKIRSDGNKQDKQKGYCNCYFSFQTHGQSPNILTKQFRFENNELI